MRNTQLKLIVLLAGLSTGRGLAPLGRLPLRAHHLARAPRILLSADDDDNAAQRRWDESNMREVWQYREEFAKNSFRTLVSWKEDQLEDQRKRAARREEGGDLGTDASKSAFAASAAAVIVGALVLRLGGRAALVSVLGLDVVADLGIGDQIDQVLAYADEAKELTVVAFIGAWIVAKVFLVDIIAIALAFSSGLLFGGVVEGALVSALGATLGSLTAFGLSRTLLQEKVEEKISKQPIARGLTKVVEEDGFKTVFVLRLSNVLPIPAGAYPYIYGTSKLNPLTFAAGYFLGSMKPYLLDSYLGVFSKQVIDGASLDDDKDVILLVGLGALVLVGVFATELANESWDLVQAEVRADKEREVAEREEALAKGLPDPALAKAEEEAWDGMIGPLNTTVVTTSVGGAIPQGVRDESAEVWKTLNEFIDDQWIPAVRSAVLERRDELERQEQGKRMLEEMKNGGQVSQNAFRAVSEKPKRVEKASAADLAGRARMASWTVDGPKGPWRELLSSVYFSFALFGSARRQWQAYPQTEEELDALLAAAEAAGARADDDVQPSTLPSSSASAPSSSSASSSSSSSSAAAGGPPAAFEPTSGAANVLRGTVDPAAVAALEEALSLPPPAASERPAAEPAGTSALPAPPLPAPPLPASPLPASPLPAAAAGGMAGGRGPAEIREELERVRRNLAAAQLLLREASAGAQEEGAGQVEARAAQVDVEGK